jgi:PAS domain S-box-containing protein
MTIAAPADQERHVSAPPDEILFKYINSTRDSVIIIDTQLRIVAANDAAYESFGRGREKLEGRRLSELVRDAGLHDGFRWTVERREPSDLRLESDTRMYDVHIAPLEIDDAQLAIGFFLQRHADRAA